MQRVPGQQGMELSSLAWARDRTDPHWRLFCGTLGGEILEVCPQELKLVAATDSYGGALWSLSNCGLNKKAGRLLAAACDDGSTRLFSIQAGVPGASYERLLSQVEGRVLCTAWNKQGTVVATGGSDGCIHCWDVTTGKGFRQSTCKGCNFVCSLMLVSGQTHVHSPTEQRIF